MMHKLYSGVIYKYTFPNNKVYVGQTIHPTSRRTQHLCESTGARNVAFWRAYKKYGTVEYEEIEVVEAPSMEELKDLLNELEIKYIAEYQSNSGKYGYNLTSGGKSCVINEEGRKHMSEARTDKTPVLQYDLNGNFIAEYSSTVDAAKAVKSHAASVYACCVGYAYSAKRKHKVQIVKGYTFRFFSDYPSRPQHIDLTITDNRTPVLQFENSGVFVKEWNSIVEAAEALGIQESNIRQCIYRKYKSAGGYQWRRKDEFDVIPNVIHARPKDNYHLPKYTKEQVEKRKRNQLAKYGKPVAQFTMDGEFVKEYRAIKEAARAVGANGPTLTNVLNGNKGHSAYGYQWRYVADLEDPKKGIPPYHRTKAVMQHSLNGDLVKEWKSVGEAAKALGVSSHTIYMAVSGHFGHNVSCGYIWRHKQKD